MFRRTLFLALTAFLLPHLALAQDAEDCKDSSLIQRFPGSQIANCERKDFDEAEIALEVDARRQVVSKRLEGQVERICYNIPENVSTLQVMRNFENALRKAGARIAVGTRDTEEHEPLTGVFEKKAKTYAEFAMNGGAQYCQTILTSKEMEQQVEANAGSLMEELSKSGHVAVYGITFATGKATIEPESDKVLEQVLELLNQNQDLKLRIEGHTDNVGKSKDNLALSKKRAAAVKDWLTKRGIAGKRLTTDGFGDKKPVQDNGTEDGRAKNRRVELVRV